jgi:Phospholipase B
MRAFATFLVLSMLAASAVYAATLFGVPVEQPAWTTVRGTANVDSSVLHNSKKSLRVEPSAIHPDAAIRSAPINLTIGKTYELTGWARTEDLTVRDLDRSPISSGAALTMSSLPFDVHSASLGGTRDWTRLSLRFVATRAQDQILLKAGSGGAFKGKAWFEGVSLDEVSSADSWPARDAVQTFGPAYRYPAAGWIYLHVEGKPYDRGYQHGYLMAKEIPEYLKRCAFELAGRADAKAWNAYRTTANALFLRGFDREILEEMRGIADGANAAGAKWLDRKIDLIDIVLANTTVEMGELADAMPMTPTGLEGLQFDLPPYVRKHDSPTEHCSAFAATGAATRDGRMVIGHVTWWPQTLAEQTNVMLDIKPETGHRVLMQSYPGGIESGTDWYQNDAGVVLTETTIDQTPFNIRGTPVAFRARMAIQYGGNIDEVVKQLGTRNNGLYTNEWLIGDAKNNEIAMYELGTNHMKLWRSSKGEWFNGTTGFYWGDNNAKDLAVNLEYLPDPQGAPQYVRFVPAVRDLAWQDLYRQYKGQIDEQFAFKAYDSAPLVSSSTMDAKITSSAMASRMMVWSEFGRPNESVWGPPRDDSSSPDHGLYPGGYYLIGAEPGEGLRASIAEKERARLAAAEPEEAKKPTLVSYKDQTDKLWKGWVLPASDSDTWLVAGSAKYYRTLQSKNVQEAVEAERIRYRGFKLAGDNPLNRFRIEEIEGELFFDALRRKMGDEPFLKLMTDYFAANTTKTVTARSFLDAARVPFGVGEPGDGPAYLPKDIRDHLASAVIVYGTTREAGTNRYAAEQLQIQYRDRNQREVPIYKDFEGAEAMLAHRDVIFVGRPETNSALAEWQEKIGLDYKAAVFKVDGKTYASERDSLVFAAKNPVDATHMVLVYAGNSPLETARSLNASEDKPWFVLKDGKSEEAAAKSSN